jgi:hypothetical protein
MTRCWTLQLLLAGSVFAACCLPPANAAGIEKSKDILCAFHLEGPIVSGDSVHLLSLISTSRLDPLDERTTSICLKSNGGSYAEGLKIAELLFSRGISTVIEYGSECYSACAIIFMAGVSPDQEIPVRKLSVGGALGFHAPYLNLPEANYSKAEVDSAAQGMRAAILALMQLSSKKTKLHGADFIKKSLLSKILEKGPQEVFFVKSVYDAARWDILLYDADKFFSRPNSIDTVKNTCVNFLSSNMDEDRPVTLDLSLKVEKFSSKFNKDDARILARNARTNDLVCELYPRTLRNDDHVSFYLCSYDYWSSKSFGDCREYLSAPWILVGKFAPEFFSYDPNMQLIRFK